MTDRTDIVEQLRDRNQINSARRRHLIAHSAADEIETLRAERDRVNIQITHSLGCEYSDNPTHRCFEETCYRQSQADKIESLRTERDRYRDALASMYPLATIGLHQWCEACCVQVSAIAISVDAFPHEPDCIWVKAVQHKENQNGT